MYEQDPDIVRWVLHLLSGERSLYSGSCGSTTQNDLINDNGEYDGNRSVDTDFTTTENDAVIAHALQEELSHVAITEASGCSYAGEEHLQASVVPQYWLGSSVRNLKPAESDSKQGDDMGATSSSNPEDKSYGDEGWSSELSNESLGKRLNQLIPVPHVPRINNEIPSADEATSDYQRLLDRLQLYDLVELKVHGDGNCQFRALSDQFYRTPEHHNFVRQQVVNQLKSHPEIYEGYVPMAYGDYLEKMSKGGEWGDHVTLQAAADSYGMKMFIVTSFKDTCYIEILPHVQKSKKGIFLSFWAEVHYNSVYPEGG